MPVVPPPESLEDDQQVLLRDPGLPPDRRAWVARERAFETRSVLGRGLGDRPARPAVDHIWLKARGVLPDDAVIHRALLAFVSDMSLLDTALLPHGKSIFSNLQVASLDHAMWFHRPFRADEWLLYAQDLAVCFGGAGIQPRRALYARRRAGGVGGAGRADQAALIGKVRNNSPAPRCWQHGAGGHRTS